MSFSGVATGIFSIRNANRTSNGEYGRLPVTVGQITNTVKEVAHQANVFGKGARGLLNTAEEIAKYDKICNKVLKAVKFASNNVNPLIVCSSGLNVVMAEDKKSSIIEEAGCLTGMFACEGFMKKHLNKLVNAIPVDKKMRAIIKGLIFVSGSIGGSTIGRKAGEKAADIIKTKEEPKLNKQQTANLLKEKTQSPYTKLSYVS